MAKWTATELSNDILEHIGVKSLYNDANANSFAKVLVAVYSAHDALSGFGLAPYDVEEIPEWAQPLLRDWVEPEIKPYFGKPVSADQKEMEQRIARHKMSQQLALSNMPLPTIAEYF